MLTEFILATLLQFTGPLLAEKLLLTGYVVLLFLSFRYLLNALKPDAVPFSLFAGILVSNFFLYMGFWNFCYSVCLLLFTVGYYIRWQQRMTPRSLAVLCTGGLAVYMAHAVSWVVCFTAVAIMGLPELISAVPGRHIQPRLVAVRSALLQYVLPLFCLLPPGFFMLIYLMRAQGHSVQGAIAAAPSWRERLWPLYSLSFLHTMFFSDLTLRRTVAAVLAMAMLSSVGVALWRHNWRGTSVLFLSLICAAIVVFGPDSVGSGLYIHARVALYACLFLVVWLALQNWPRWAANLMAALFCGMAVIALAVRLPALSKWSRGLSAYVDVGQHIRPRSTVAWFTYGPLDDGVNPYGSPLGLLSSRVIIDLANYEAATDHFLTQWRPERSPVDTLFKLKQVGAGPPEYEVDIARYEKLTHGRVDYIICQGGVTSGGSGIELSSSRQQLANYTLVSSGQRGNLRLYQRNSPSANHGAVAGEK